MTVTKKKPAKKSTSRTSKLPLPLTLEPMEALSVDEIPVGAEWQYEPKWDGFRCIAFRNGDNVHLQSKSGQPLERYFPELVEALRQASEKKFVLDGEIVIPRGQALSFDALLQRIHPAASRVRKLSEETPALYIVFDLLADDRGRSLLDEPLAERRRRLEAFFGKALKGIANVKLSPATTDVRQAKRWFATAGAALDGVIAKRVDFGYRSGDRTGMQKIKPSKTVDCVVGGFRYASRGKAVGSLLLGLYNDQGLLDHVGFTSSFTNAERKALLTKVEPLIAPPGFTGKAPGGPSRWSTARSAEWEPLKPKLVVEVAYDHFTGGRFRHGTTTLRWRPDKKPRKCTLDQLASAGTKSLRLLA
jgi:ATP-dependent DNA ligase